MTEAGQGPARASKADTAYAAIRARIVSGDFAPGARLVLDQLARELDVSPVPVREAIRRLEAEGYVNFQRNLGATVATIDIGAYGESMETLAVLEAAATVLAAPGIGRRELKLARKINDGMVASLERFDPISFTDGNREFHQLLFGGCPNRHMVEIIEREWDRLGAIRRSTFAFVPARARQSVAEHTALVDMIEAHDSPQRIEEFAREHRLRTARAFLERPTISSGEGQ